MRGLDRFQPRVYFGFGCYVIPWTRRPAHRPGLSHPLPPTRCRKPAISPLAAYSLHQQDHEPPRRRDAPLGEVEGEAENVLEFVRNTQLRSSSSTSSACQLGLAPGRLRGLTAGVRLLRQPCAVRRRSVFERRLRGPILAWGGPAVSIRIRKLGNAHLLAADRAPAIEAATEAAKQLLWTSAVLLRGRGIPFLRRAFWRARRLTPLRLPTNGPSISRHSSRAPREPSPGGRKSCPRISGTPRPWSPPRSLASKVAIWTPSPL